MIKSRVKKSGTKRIVFDNLVDSRTGKKASIVVPISCSGDIGAAAGAEFSRDLSEMGFVARKGDCPSKLWFPKNLEEVTARANVAGDRFMEMFGRP